MTPIDPFNLQRFLDAQNPVYDQVCRELRAGEEAIALDVVHFPAAAGLG